MKFSCKLFLSLIIFYSQTNAEMVKKSSWEQKKLTQIHHHLEQCLSQEKHIYLNISHALENEYFEQKKKMNVFLAKSHQCLTMTQYRAKQLKTFLK